VTQELGALSGDFHIEELSISVGTTPTPVLSLDSTRWAVVFGNPSSAAGMYVSTLGTVLANTGFFVPSSQSPIVFLFRDHPTLPWGPWFAAATALGSKLSVISIYYRPKGLSDADRSMIEAAMQLKGAQSS
jgi:hypothetical protein